MVIILMAVGVEQYYKNVNGKKTISNSGGTKKSGTESWNGSYYINTRTQSFSIVSFTVDN